MGTPCRIVLYAPDEEASVRASRDAFERIAELESVLSDYRQDSEVSRLSRAQAGLWHPVSSDLAEAIQLSRSVHEASRGAFDPTLGTLTKLWRQSRSDGRLPDPDTLGLARSRAGLHLVEFHQSRRSVRFEREGVRFDFGGVGKGSAADEAMAVLRGHGIRAALIDFGGDLLAGDAPPDRPDGWRVSVEDGLGTRRGLLLTNQAVATSGDLEQFVEIDGVRYSHIIDPRTGLGLTERRAATVIAPNAALADALASAACVLGEQRMGGVLAAFPEAAISIQTSE
jgi:thiamine biosynthesis lipoprotein